MSEVSPERKEFNEFILPKFIKNYVKKDDLVMEVGKPDDGWGYREMLEGTRYVTLDRNGVLNPDIIDDMENTKVNESTIDCIICFGVMEQCANPFKLVAGIRKILKPGGYALFGIMSIGYPLWQDVDLCRFTPQGADRLLENFKIVDHHEYFRDNIPTYIFRTVQK